MKYHAPYDRTDNDDASYVDQNALLGVEGSVLPAAAAEHPQRELVNFITDTGLIPDTNDLRQVGQSVQQGTVWYGPDTGTANHIIVTLTPQPRQFIKGMMVKVIVKFNVTGATDMNVNGIGAVACQHYQSPFTSGILLANDAALFLYTGSAWELIAGARIAPVPGPIYLIAPKIVYVNGLIGDDVNYDGTTSSFTGSGHGPFKTIQRARDESYKYNLNGYDFTIMVANGTYTGPVIFGHVNGAGTVHLIGNTSSPSNCVIATPTGSGLVQNNLGFENGVYECSGFRLFTYPGVIGGALGVGVYCASAGASLALRNMQYGGVPTHQILAQSYASITLYNSHIIESGANAQAHMVADSGQITIDWHTGFSGANPAGLTILGPVNYSIAFAWSSNGRIEGYYGSGISGAGYVHGPKFVADLIGVIFTQGFPQSYFPGDSSGFLYNGGQYVS
jgi:hypothetical protein